jgi:ligand-binding sensor domain-containing protein
MPGDENPYAMRIRRTLPLLALPVALALGVLALVVVRVRHTLQRSAATVEHRGEVGFEMLRLGGPSNAGFQIVSSPAVFRDAAFFDGQLYISGPAGLFAYSPDGTLRRTWRVGADLPAAPLGKMVVGRLRGASAPELIIATDGEGVLLLKTDDTVRQLRPTDEAARSITAALPLATGDLLIGTRQRGLLVWNGKGLGVFQPGLAKLDVTALAADAGGFWAGTRNAGVLHWTAGTAEYFSTEQGMPDVEVESIAVHGPSVFVGTPVGVEQFLAGRPERLLGKNFFAQALLPEPRSLTISTMDEGMRTVALDASPRPHGLSPAADADPVEAFLTGNDGSVYALRHDGVARRESDGAWLDVVRPQAAALTDGNVSALGFDADGRLWVGYFDRGLDIVTGDRTQHVEDGHIFCVNRIALDPSRHTMAVATANGLVLFDREGKPRQVLLRRDGLIADHVTDIVFRPNGMTLATPAGLTFVDAGQTPQSLYAFEGLVNNHVYALGIQPDGETLAGTLGGLSVLEHGAVQRNLNAANSGLKHNWVTAIAPDEKSGWTVGTYGAGVMGMSRDGKIQALTPPFVVNPNAMLRTRQHLMVGSLGRGLWVESLATGRWTHLTRGLPSENVTALAEREGMIYVGTDNGLVKIAEESLNQ